MKFTNPILNFERTHGQTQSNVPLQLFKTRGGDKNAGLQFVKKIYFF